MSFRKEDLLTYGTAFKTSEVRFVLDREVMTNASDNALIEKTEAEIKQVVINTILAIQEQVGDEVTLQLICEALDLDYEEIKEKVEGQESLSYALNQTTQESIAKTENLNGVQINSLMNIIRMVKEQSITRKEAISIIVNTLGISKETAENFIEDAGEVLEDGAISGTGGTTSVKN